MFEVTKSSRDDLLRIGATCDGPNGERCVVYDWYTNDTTQEYVEILVPLNRVKAYVLWSIHCSCESPGHQSPFRPD